jgi:hypothetical protein
MTSESWRLEALRRFPAFAEDIQANETPYALWSDLWLAFDSAYNSGDTKLIAAVYAFALWCAQQPRGASAAEDLPTCVSVCFIEHIPTNQKALDDMPRWLTRADVERLKDALSYHVGEDGYARILKRYAV